MDLEVFGGHAVALCGPRLVAVRLLARVAARFHRAKPRRKKMARDEHTALASSLAFFGLHRDS